MKLSTGQWQGDGTDTDRLLRPGAACSQPGSACARRVCVMNPKPVHTSDVLVTAARDGAHRRRTQEEALRERGKAVAGNLAQCQASSRR